jgi:glycerophosphoryl diester phosphodiesterase
LDRSDWLVEGPLVTAHRGAARVAPENTLAAFEAAAVLGVDAVELDTKLTRDGQAVVIHDQTLERTTNGRGRVSAHTLAELEALDAGSHFGPEYAGEAVPSLRRVLEALAGRLLVNIEIGNYVSVRDSLPQAVVATVRGCGVERRVLFSSFNPLALRTARGLAPDIPCGLLLMPRQPGWQRWLFPRMAPHEFEHLQESLIRSRWRPGSGRRRVAWVVSDLERMRGLLRQGVSGLITDRPELALQARREVLGD